jgi:hypothetical protein
LLLEHQGLKEVAIAAMHQAYAMKNIDVLQLLMNYDQDVKAEK